MKELDRRGARAWATSRRGVRHLVWDTVHGFGLRSIYLGGWAVVAASVALTVAAWIASLFVGG